MMDGEIVRLGGRQLDPIGLDLLGVIVGSEGLPGVVTEVTVRILPKMRIHTVELLDWATGGPPLSALAAGTFQNPTAR